MNFGFFYCVYYNSRREEKARKGKNVYESKKRRAIFLKIII